jgi:hypothetical protein
MRHIKLFENFNNGTLIIIDVQKSFKKFFTDNYLKELNKYASTFNRVYQIWDNHVEGKNVDKDYLYDDDPDKPNNNDLYTFPNQVESIEKRYNYDVDADFYKKILDKKTYNDIKQRESQNSLKRGDMFLTNEGTAIIYIGNNHRYFHVPIKLYELFVNLKGKEVTMVGGSDQECFLDIETTARSMGVKVNRNFKYIYSATHCPIR